MFNYDLIAALEAVMREGSFQRAARKLRITQSAVSQRIRALETEYGAPVLIRKDPLQATALGEKLIAHVHKVQNLERELMGIETGEAEQEYKRIRIGVNADSLAIWFFKACAPILQAQRMTVDILVDNEEHTLELLRRGEVSGCISSQKRSIPGASSEALGVIQYICVCSPEFQKRFFINGFTKEAIKSAPTALFDAKDTAHERFLRNHFSVKMPNCPYHLVPSNEGFLQCALSGAAYTMIPRYQALPYLKQGMLCDLGKGNSVEVKLYLHWILRQTETLRKFQHALIVAASRQLE